MAATLEYTLDDLLDRSPTLSRLTRKSRLAPSRLQDLLRAARTTQPPKEPELTDCCGSSCRPCVRDLWREERSVWEEVHPDGVDGEEEEEEEDEAEGKREGDEGKKEQKEGGGPKVEIGLGEPLEALSVREDGVKDGTGKEKLEEEQKEG